MLKPVSESFYSVYQATEVTVQEEVIEVVLQRFLASAPLRLHCVYCQEACVKIPYPGPHDGAFSLVSINHSPPISFLNHNLILNICPSFFVLTPDFFRLQFKLPSFKDLSEPTVNHTGFISLTIRLPKWARCHRGTQQRVACFWPPSGWKVSN